MGELNNARAGLKTVLNAAPGLAGLRVYTYQPDSLLEYPALVMEATPPINYQLTLASRSFVMDLPCTLYLQVQSSDEGWSEMDNYRSPSGDKSIKGAVLADRTLNGQVDDASINASSQVMRNRNADGKFWEFSCRFTLHFIKTVAL